MSNEYKWRHFCNAFKIVCLSDDNEELHKHSFNSMWYHLWCFSYNFLFVALFALPLLLLLLSLAISFITLWLHAQKGVMIHVHYTRISYRGDFANNKLLLSVNDENRNIPKDGLKQCHLNKWVQCTIARCLRWFPLMRSTNYEYCIMLFTNGPTLQFRFVTAVGL